MQYTANTGASAVALAAATAKTVLNVISTADINALIVEFGVSFDGTSATAVPVYVELCRSTQAGAGTSTSMTPVQTRGVTAASRVTAANNYSAEPTALTTLKEWLVPPTSGLVVQAPLGREVEAIAGTVGICLRLTAPAIVNVRAYMEFVQGAS